MWSQSQKRGRVHFGVLKNYGKRQEKSQIAKTKDVDVIFLGILGHIPIFLRIRQLLFL